MRSVAGAGAIAVEIIWHCQRPCRGFRFLVGVAAASMPPSPRLQWCVARTMSGQDERMTASCRTFLRRKWRLVLLVFLALAAAELVAVRLWDEFHPVQPKYLDRSPPPITKAQKQSAVDLVRESGTVERINSGQAWDITEVTDTPRTRTVHVYVEWDGPVESNGPWLTNGASKWLGRSCRNVRSRFHLPISNVRFLRLSVSLEGMEIVRLWPHSPPHLIEYRG